MKTSYLKEIIIKTIRETPGECMVDVPAKAVEYWQSQIATKPDFDGEKEHLVVLILDSKLRVKSHCIVSMGLLNQTLVHAREVFRPAVALAGAHIVMMHNHPSGDPAPSSDDMRTTRDMQAAGRILGIPLLDHVVVGNGRFISIKEIGGME